MGYKVGEIVKIKNITMKVRLSEEQIQQRVAEITEMINRDYQGKKLVMIYILTGATLFFSDLVKQLDDDLDLTFTSMDVESYGNEKRTTGLLKVYKDLNIDIAGKHVIIVEDIVDTGFTLAYLVESIKSRYPASIRLCCLLNKQCKRGEFSDDFRKKHREKLPEIMGKIEMVDKMINKEGFVGFVTEDYFVVGYGLDYKKKLRHLRFIGEVIKVEEDPAETRDLQAVGSKVLTL